MTAWEIVLVLGFGLAAFLAIHIGANKLESREDD